MWRLSEHGDHLHTEFIYDEENENRLEWKEGQIPSNIKTHNASDTTQKEDCPSNLATESSSITLMGTGLVQC